jgi:hypothetical protein
VQVGHDLRQHRTDDGLVERRQEHAEQDGAEDLELGSNAQPERRILSD